MKRLFFLLLTAFSVAGCDLATAQRGGEDARFATLPKLQPGEAVATFASGCFWTTEHVFDDVKGVRAAYSGYAGGKVANPTYEQVAGRGTGHAEAVQIYYDPKVVSYQDLLNVFFAEHDPTTLNQQGPDVGDEYRSAVFYRTPEEKAAVESTIQRLNGLHKFAAPIVTQVAPLQTFYPAENYHQGYAVLHPENPYLQHVSEPRYTKCRAAMPGLFKAGK